MIHNLKIATLMYLIKHKLVPKTIIDLFKYNYEHHQYNTRSHDKFYYPIVTREYILKSFKHTGPRIWNNLSDDITSCLTVSSFKVKYKQYLIKQYL